MSSADWWSLCAAGAAYWWQTAGKTPPEAELKLYGNVDIREVRLAFNGSEPVDEILVDEGDHVRRGQPHAAQLSYQRIKAMEGRKLASAQQADEAEGNSLATAAGVVAAEATLAEAELPIKDA